MYLGSFSPFLGTFWCLRQTGNSVFCWSWSRFKTARAFRFVFLFFFRIRRISYTHQNLHERRNDEAHKFVFLGNEMCWALRFSITGKEGHVSSLRSQLFDRFIHTPAFTRHLPNAVQTEAWGQISTRQAEKDGRGLVDEIKREDTEECTGKRKLYKLTEGEGKRLKK